MFRERLATLLQLNNNAFVQIVRDRTAAAATLYHPGATAEAILRPDGSLWMRFQLTDGDLLELPYKDVIHLRDEYAENDIFGAPKRKH